MARDPYKYFRIEARELIAQLGPGVLELERTGSGGEIVPRLLRVAHTLKGAARVVRLPEIADRAHSVEDLLSPFRGQAERVPRATVEALLALVDEIVSRVTALAAPPPEMGKVATSPAAPVATAPLDSGEEGAFWAARGDASEVDRVLESIAEAYAQLAALGQVSALAGKARQVSDQLADNLTAAAQPGSQRHFGGIGALIESANLLLTHTTTIERSVSEAQQRIDREIRQVRDAVEQLRLVPASGLFPTLERMARDSALALGREVVFTGSGGDIRLDVQVVRVVQDALQQLVRNAVAHGIEPVAEREAAGKPPSGRVDLSVLRRGSHVVFRCTDDGRGIDLPALGQAAARRGGQSFDPERLDGAALAKLLLQGGVSTSAVLSEVAGRGIGMDIVREAVSRLGARFAVTTKPGEGTQFDITVSQSVSSVDAIVVEGGGGRATIPLYAVRQTLRVEPDTIHRTPFGEAIIHDGEAIPLVSLERMLEWRNAPSWSSGSLSAVVVAASAGRAAIGVDHVHGTTSIVFRPLPELAPAAPVVAGASLEPDGSPLLMLDPDGLVAMALQAGASEEASAAARRSLLVIDDSLTTRMLEQSILEAVGYRVDLAVSGEEGLERARAGEYALILVDVEMPGMDGFTFIEHIRQDQQLRDTPAILVTSRNAPEDKRRGEQVGAQGYVVKSEFDQAELLDRIRQLVA